ncbi:WSC-domain-containing protein [Dentipellis sp. KUC8613]|nr:WSC-domain-containing protein [Dentipellis sp. KUC8613]
MNLFTFSSLAVLAAIANTVVAGTPTLATRTVSNSSWTAQGCFLDNPSARILAESETVQGSLTVESCLAFCAQGNYSLAGVEFSEQCLCANVTSATLTPEPAENCSLPCAGNASETCGGPDRLFLYSSGAFNASAPGPGSPVEVQSVGEWTALGCYNDSLTNHTLGAQVNVTNTTVESCTSACYDAGFTLAGLEFGSGCFCDNEFFNFSAPQAPSNCDISCAGNKTELCGGPSFLTAYNYTGNFTADTQPAARIKLHNAGWYTAYVRIVYNGTTSDRLGGSITGGRSHTVNLTEFGLLTEGEEFQVKLDVVSGTDKTSNTVITYSSSNQDCTADFNSGGGVQNAWIAFDAFSDCD